MEYAASREGLEVNLRRAVQPRGTTQLYDSCSLQTDDSGLFQLAEPTLGGEMVSLSLARRSEGFCRDTLWCGEAPLEAFKQDRFRGIEEWGMPILLYVPCPCE